ncbi:MAG: hypothetical protein QM802_02890 [Agriterribacter sp.]
MNIDGNGVGFNVRRLTTDEEAENYPSWSPDGTKITYVRDLNGSAIYVINADGTNKKRLSATPGFDVTPGWSPDGSRIVYSKMLGFPIPNQIPKTEIHIMNADGTGDTTILPSSDFSVEPRWSVKNLIAFLSLRNGGQHIFSMNIDGTNLKQLTTLGSNAEPVFSPDGSQICFGSDRQGDAKLNIFLMNSDGSNQTALTNFAKPVEIGDVDWSKDGKKIIFEYDIDGKKQSDPNAYADVRFINVETRQVTSTQQPCSCVGCAPRWRSQ